MVCVCVCVWVVRRKLNCHLHQWLWFPIFFLAVTLLFFYNERTHTFTHHFQTNCCLCSSKLNSFIKCHQHNRPEVLNFHTWKVYKSKMCDFYLSEMCLSHLIWISFPPENSFFLNVDDDLNTTLNLLEICWILSQNLKTHSKSKFHCCFGSALICILLTF